VCKGETKEKTDAGTIPYMPPEVHTGENTESCPGIDIWALGIMMYLMLFGEYPFKGESEEELIWAIVE
jgi:serine/threonine protein kinase